MMRTVQVHKFGGASLADAPAFAHAVRIVGQQDGKLVIVVSAMSGTTDLLLEGAEKARVGDPKPLAAIADRLRKKHAEVARALVVPGPVLDAILSVIDASMTELATLAQGIAIVRELTPRTKDELVARGERLSAHLFSASLHATGRASAYVDALQLIRTDGQFGNAAPDLKATDVATRRVLLPLLRAGTIPVVPGFFGATPDGQLATLGRGGTDVTAVLIGRALGAREVSLWKDVPGLLTADPRTVPDARLIPQLHVREAAELAYHGAKALHPRALTPIIGRDVRVRVRPFADPASTGTEVSGRRTLTRYPVKAVSAVKDQALVTVAGNGMLGVPGIAARTFGAMHRSGISVSLISQASSEHSICFTVPQSSAARAKSSLLEAFAEEIARREIDGVEVRPGMATLAVVGPGMANTPGVVPRVFAALSTVGINVVSIAQGSSELNLSVVVQGTDAAKAQQQIHDQFQLAKIGGGAHAAAPHTDVVLLGFGKVGRQLAHLIAQRNGTPPALRAMAVVDSTGFVFEPKGLSRRRLSEIAAAKGRGESLSALPGGRAGDAQGALTLVGRHALSRPVLVDCTAAETAPLLSSALASGMDLVLANKRPLAGPREVAEALWADARQRGRRILHETTVGAGLPVFDTYYKLYESGDRVARIQGSTSGTLGFLLTEVGSGRPFSAALRAAMVKGYTEPDPREDLSGQDVARKALILGRLLGFRGELQDVEIEPLVPSEYVRLPLPEFLERLGELDPWWADRAATARAQSRVLRYLATVTKRKVSVSLAAVEASDSFAGLSGTDNQIAFTTRRYDRHNPLVIKGPGAGLAVTAAGVLNDVLKLAAS
ncbi:MAG TPA: aspartate kinase [Vicinamibacteria bacterium]|nr:aspartate kinase [Vicinamibacteria bacterium]